MTALWGRFEERVDPWTGTLQTRYSDEFADLTVTGTASDSRPLRSTPVPCRIRRLGGRSIVQA